MMSEDRIVKTTSGMSVVRRVKAVKQPRGGYINPKTMDVFQMDDGKPSPLDHRIENIQASLVGTAVDCLTRLASGAKPQVAFKVSLRGAGLLGSEVLARAEADIGSLKPGRVDASAINAACRLVSYDVAFRAGPSVYNPDAMVSPDSVTCEHISIMVGRALEFFKVYGPIVRDGFGFLGAYTDLVSSGDGDFLTENGLWDFKVSVSPPTKEHTLQLLMYWIMGLKTGYEEFASVLQLGIFNPRLNKVHCIAVENIPDEVADEVARDVIGYL